MSLIIKQFEEPKAALITDNSGEYRIMRVTSKLAKMSRALFFLATLVLANQAIAETLNLVTGDGFPPFTGQNLPNGGLATEIVQRVFNEMGYEVNIDFKPWKRGYSDAKKKKYLATFPYEKNAKRLRDFSYSQPLYNFAHYFFIKDGAAIEFTKDEDLQGLRACLPIGYNPLRLQDMVDKGIVTLERPVDMDACFQMLERGRVDLVRVHQRVGWKVIEKVFKTKAGFRVLDKPVRENIAHLIVAKDHTDGVRLLERFDKTLQTLNAEGVIEEIIQRHIK